jgi:hypothetical protein
MSDDTIESMSLRDAIGAASNAASEAVLAGLMLDNVFWLHQARTNYVHLVKFLKKRPELSALLVRAREDRFRETNIDREAYLSIAGRFTNGLSEAIIVCLQVAEKRRDVVTALRLATNHPATLVNGFHHESYFDAAVSFALERGICFVPEDTFDRLHSTRGGAADVAKSCAENLTWELFVSRFDEISALYVEMVELDYILLGRSPIGFLGEDKFCIAIKKEAERAAYMLAPQEILKAIREVKPSAIRPDTRKALELLRNGEKPGIVAARLGKSAAAIRQAKSRARRRGDLKT